MPRPWIQTYTGIKFEFPVTEKMLHEADIAHALSHICRYNGHTSNFYSAAQHCIIMHDHLLKVTGDERLAFTALMHEVAEAYLGDLVGPFKHLMVSERFSQLEQNIEIAASRKFNFIWPWPSEVKILDSTMRVVEQQLMPNKPVSWPEEDMGHEIPNITITPLTPPKARFEFMKRFKQAQQREVRESSSGRS